MFDKWELYLNKDELKALHRFLLSRDMAQNIFDRKCLEQIANKVATMVATIPVFCDACGGKIFNGQDAHGSHHAGCHDWATKGDECPK